MFSNDSKTIASGSEDGTVKLWDFKTGRYLKTFSLAKPYTNMNITGVKGLTDTEKASLKALGAVENKQN